MFLRSAVVLSAFLLTATAANEQHLSIVPAGSSLGRSLLRHATQLRAPSHRVLDENMADQQQYYNYNNQNGEQQDEENEQEINPFIFQFNLVFTGCQSTMQVNLYDGNNNNNRLLAQDENQSPVYTQNIVTFQLCPSISNSCQAGCDKGGEYAMDLATFLNVYLPYKENQLQYECQRIQQSCYCDNANDDQACYNYCYQQAGWSECIEQEGNEQNNNGQENVQENYETAQNYLECQGMCIVLFCLEIYAVSVRGNTDNRLF